MSQIEVSTINNIQVGEIYNLKSDDYLIFIDKFNRKWKLTPVTNPNIEMPFIITPLPK